MRIFLIRHAQSQANIDKTIYQTTADHAIHLSENGLVQAEKAKEALEKYFNKHIVNNPKNMRMWVSPYKRARQTAEIINNTTFYFFDEYYKAISDVKEDISLCEQQFGLFDGLTDDQLKEKYPNEHAHYEKTEKFQGRFWARMPLGESRFDVAIRVKQMFGTWKRDASKKEGEVKDIVVVSHGVTIRAIQMQYLHRSVEWFESEPNPGNCSIQLIENGDDKGFIFKGYDSKGKLIDRK